MDWKKASRRGTETAREVGVSWFEKRKRCVQTVDPHLTGLLCGWIKINMHTYLIIILSVPCVPDQAAHLIICRKDTSFCRQETLWEALASSESGQPSRSSAQTGLPLGQTGQQSLPFLWDWSGIERAVRKITPRREWWGWGPLGGGEKWWGTSQRSGNQFLSPYRSISLEACKGHCCPFKVPPGFTSWIALALLCGKHEDPISFPYNSKRSEQQGPFRLGVTLAIKFLALLSWGWTLIRILSPAWKWTSLLFLSEWFCFLFQPPPPFLWSLGHRPFGN